MTVTSGLMTVRSGLVRPVLPPVMTRRADLMTVRLGLTIVRSGVMTGGADLMTVRPVR